MKSKSQKIIPPGYYQSSNVLMLTRTLDHNIIGTSTVYHIPKSLKYHEVIVRLVTTVRTYCVFYIHIKRVELPEKH